jgi:hypothetical protein
LTEQKSDSFLLLSTLIFPRQAIFSGAWLPKYSANEGGYSGAFFDEFTTYIITFNFSTFLNGLRIFSLATNYPKP